MWTRFRNDYNGDQMIGCICLDPSSVYGKDFATFKNLKNRNVNIILTMLLDNEELCKIIDNGIDEYIKTLLDEDYINKDKLKHFISRRTKHIIKYE